MLLHVVLSLDVSHASLTGCKLPSNTVTLVDMMEEAHDSTLSLVSLPVPCVTAVHFTSACTLNPTHIYYPWVTQLPFKETEKRPQALALTHIVHFLPSFQSRFPV